MSKACRWCGDTAYAGMSFKWGKQGAVHAHLLHFYIVGLPCSSFTQVKTLLSTHEQYMQLAGWVFGPLPYKHCMTESWCFDPVTGKLREMLDADYPPNCRRASLPPAYENCYPIDENGMHRELRVQASTPSFPSCLLPSTYLLLSTPLLPRTRRSRTFLPRSGVARCFAQCKS